MSGEEAQALLNIFPSDTRVRLLEMTDMLGDDRHVGDGAHALAHVRS
jgi:hypothetical protein